MKSVNVVVHHKLQLRLLAVKEGRGEEGRRGGGEEGRRGGGEEGRVERGEGRERRGRGRRGSRYFSPLLLSSYPLLSSSPLLLFSSPPLLLSCSPPLLSWEITYTRNSGFADELNLNDASLIKRESLRQRSKQFLNGE